MYTSLLEDISSVLSSSNFIAGGLEVYPDDYDGDINNETEFCRVNILPTNSFNIAHGAVKILDGVIIFTIYTKAGEGQLRVMQLSDFLDDFFQNKKLSNGTELGTSSLTGGGLDTKNKTLYSIRYTVPFKIYGE